MAEIDCPLEADSVVYLDYEQAPIYIEDLNLPMRKSVREMDHQRDIREGVIFQCEKGYFAGFRGIPIILRFLSKGVHNFIY